GTGFFVNAETGDDANDGSQLSPYKTVTHALACIDGSEADPVTINVGPGVYSASTNGETFPLYMESWVSIKGHGQQMTVLDGEYEAKHIIYCDNVHHLTIEGCTITGGSALDEGTIDGRGAGIYVSGSTPEIIGNEIIDNGADEGAGIYCHESEVTIAANLITDNVAARGGAIYCYAGSQAIANNEITLNYADDGGGLYFDGYSAAQVHTNRIVANFSGGKGGGIACVNASYPAINGNAIMENEAEYGGGVSCHDGGTPGLENNWFAGNEAYKGGGIYSDASEPRILNNLLYDNYATQDGGGIYLTGSGAIPVVNCTVTNNLAESEGSGIGSCRGCALTLENSIVWMNDGDELWTQEALITATCCDIEGGYEGQGNLNADPSFVTGPLGDFYLSPLSPCVDAGSRSAADAGLDTFTTRADQSFDSGTVDVGYHYPIQ
ncbi:MAG: right-handed parallel beta-helix repeat-containing protein, partial [Candidatus Coatesbacteria bacterium]|nr:right-handed parallel beta-helix repeat-containing protein [Candidatus Coatesbacteria bacterium]